MKGNVSKIKVMTIE